MELFKRLFGGKVRKRVEEEARLEAERLAFEAEWEPLEAFEAASKSETEIVSVIASAIAARDYPESEFKVKRVLSRTQTSKDIAVIAAAIAAGESTESQLVVKHIYQKRNA